MKKRYWLLALCGVLLGYEAKTEFWFEDEREVYFPITKESLQADVREKRTLKEQKTADAKASSKARTPQSINSPTSNETFFEEFKARMASEYPYGNFENKAARHLVETNSRIALLKNLRWKWEYSSSWGKVDYKTVASALWNIARNKNENILVRRQALMVGFTITEQHRPFSRQRMPASNSEAKLIHLLTFADEQMIENLTPKVE